MPSSFSRRDNLVFFHSDVPGGHATMFDPKGRSLDFRMDVSSFNDPERRYTWGFEYDGPPLKKGALFVFAHTDIDAVAETEADGSDRKSTRLNSSHIQKSRMPSSA